MYGRGKRKGWKLEDLPPCYQAQARAQLDALAARRPSAQSKPHPGLPLEPQSRYPALLAHPAGAVVVRLVRVGGRPLDDDNLAGGCKELRDAIAAALGRGGDSQGDGFFWEYAQEAGETGLRIEILKGE